jgi:VanZ family protein
MKTLVLIIRMGAWLLVILIGVLSVVPAWARPVTGLGHGFEHFAAFFVTGMAFGLGYANRFLVTAFALVLYSGLIEIVQLLVPDRHSRLSDFAIDAAAVAIGVIATATATRRVSTLLA